MSRMLNAVKILFSGKGVLDKQLCLFSVCGLFGLIAGYLALWQENYIELTLLQKLMFMSAVAIYVLFVVGYEVLFLQKRELPNFDMDIFKVFRIFFTNRPASVFQTIFDQNDLAVFVVLRNNTIQTRSEKTFCIINRYDN